MQRIVYLNTQPCLQAQQFAALETDFEILTPAQLAAKALGVRKRSLSDIARQLLYSQRIQIAPALVAQQALYRVIFKTAIDAEGMTRSVFPIIKALLRATPTLSAPNSEQSPRVQQLIQYAQDYRAELKAEADSAKLGLKGYIDSSELLWRAAEILPPRRRVLMYGYFCPKWDELEFLNAIADEGSIFFLPLQNHSLFTENKAAVEWLEQQGWQIRTMPSQPETIGECLAEKCLNLDVKTPDANVYRYSDLEAEVRGILAQVKQLLVTGVAAKDIVLVTRNETMYGSLLLDIAWEYQLPLRALYNVPFTSTRVGAWLNSLVDMVQAGFPFEDAAKLFCHPLCTNPAQGYWAKAKQLRPVGLAAWQPFAAEFLALDLSLLQFPEQMRRDEWVERWKQILRRFDLRRRSARWAKEAVAFNRFDQALNQLAQPEAEVLTWDAFVQSLKACLAVLDVPAQPGRGGVELHSPASVTGARYRYVFVLGAAEGILPAPVKDDPVLDFYERQQHPELRLETAAAIARRELLAFYMLLQTATEQVVFSYPGLMGKAAQIPSPYLKRLDVREAIAPVYAASLQEARQVYLRQNSEMIKDDVLQGAIAAFKVEQNRESSLPQDEYDGVIGFPLDPAEREFSVSQLTQLGQCPFKWFAHKVLKLSGVKETEVELNPSLRGNLYHKVLELALQNGEQETLERLEETFLNAEASLNFPEIPAWQAQRLEHIQLLRRTMKQENFQSERAVQLESWFEGTWQGLKIRGRVDRIDRTVEGLVLMDYKTSSHAPDGVKDEKGKAQMDVQLSLYRDVAAPALFPGEAIAEVLYYSLTKGKKLPKALPSPEELELFATRCKTHLTSGSYPVQPDIDRHACKYCEFDLVCRQGSRLSRKGGNES